MSESAEPDFTTTLPPEIVQFVQGQPQAGALLRRLVKELVDDRFEQGWPEAKAKAIEAAEKAAGDKAKAQTPVWVREEVTELWSGKRSEAETIVHRLFDEKWQSRVGRRITVIAILASVLGLGGLTAFFQIAKENIKAEADGFVKEQVKQLQKAQRQAIDNLKAEQQTIVAKSDKARDQLIESETEYAAAKRNLEQENLSLQQLLQSARENASSFDQANDTLESITKKDTPELRNYLNEAFREQQLHNARQEIDGFISDLSIGTPIALPEWDVENSLKRQPGRWAKIEDRETRVQNIEYDRKWGEIPKNGDFGESRSRVAGATKERPFVWLIKVNP